MKKIAAFIILLFISVIGSTQSNDQILISNSLFVPIEKNKGHKIGDRNIPIRVIKYGDVRDFVCINLHANEMTSVKAAMAILEQTGGTLIKIENNNQRVIPFRLKGITYKFDPNRIFSRNGIEQTLRENGRISRDAINEVEKFAQYILNLITDSNACVIALHNNTEEAYSVLSYLPGSNREKDAKAVYVDSLQDVDDIAFTTDSLLYKKMTDFGFNSIWQDNEKVKKDGSLSVYYGERNKRYINVETQHGKVDQYKIMLEKLILILSDENRESSDIKAEQENTDTKF